MSILFSRPEPNTLPGLYSIDTETARIAPRTEIVIGARASTKTTPFITPALALGSITGAGATRVLSPNALHDELVRLLPTERFAFHNVAFDYFVLTKAFPDLEPALKLAVDEGRILDTMILETLIQIARGGITVDKAHFKSYHALDDLALRRCGLTLHKDDTIRLTFGDYIGQLGRLSLDHLYYAAQDAAATYRVRVSQEIEATNLIRSCRSRYPIYPDATERFGLLSERIQVSGAIALAWFEQYPLHVDQGAVAARRATLLTELAGLEATLIAAKLARRTPKKQQFKLSLTAVRAQLTEAAARLQLLIPRTPSGKLSTKADDWGAHASDLSGDLRAWIRYNKVRKVLTTYIEPYSRSPVHYPSYINIGARTTRTSCRSPNAQNIPKRKESLRQLFVAPPGHVLIEADYAAAELRALAQVYHSMFGGSVLEDSLAAGRDPLNDLAERIYGTVDKKSRQAAKAAAYGLPGGMGVRRFQVYLKTMGLPLTEGEARDLRQRAMAADPQLAQYLATEDDPPSLLARAATALGMSPRTLAAHLRCLSDDDIDYTHVPRRLRKLSKGALEWKVPASPAQCANLANETTRSPTGLIRGGARYTEARNTPFQALVAHGAKLALWRLYSQGDALCKPFVFVHDSIAVITTPELTSTATELLRACMEGGMADVLDDVAVKVDVGEPAETWAGKAQSASLHNATT